MLGVREVHTSTSHTYGFGKLVILIWYVLQIVGIILPVGVKKGCRMGASFVYFVYRPAPLPSELYRTALNSTYEREIHDSLVVFTVKTPDIKTCNSLF